MARTLKLGAQGLALVGVAGLLALLVWKVVHHPGAKLNSAVAQGKKPAAPNFTLPRLEGQGKVSLASLRGKAVVINFWNAYCVPCKAEAPLLERAWRQWRAQGVVLVGVDFEDFTGDARRFARKHGMTYPLLHDSRRSVVDLYGLTGYPETFFVDRRGRLVGKHFAGQISKYSDLETNIRLALRT
jgi:cytochrome c biogenesis protein CcmG/thiol:disulfide interchange protein DsbE